MVFGKVKRNTLSEEITDKLLSLIKEKKLCPGDKLPPERELAETMQVSRPPLREALCALSLLNIIEMRHGDGIYVTSLEPELLIEPLEFIISLDTSTFVQLFEARKVLEPGLAALAAQRITDTEIQELEGYLQASINLHNDLDAYLQLDLKLHETIATIAQNPILSRVMSSLSQLSLASRRRTAYAPGAADTAFRDHHAIVAALKARDPKAAYQAMWQHLCNIEQLKP